MVVQEVHAEPVQGGRALVVKARLGGGGEEVREAQLPARETAALLPREYLESGEHVSQQALLEAADEILRRLVTGRSVRHWEYRGRIYFSFLPWRGSPRSPAQSESSPSGA